MIETNNLTSDEFVSILNTVGWKCPSKRLLEKSLENSITVKYIIDDETVGMARFITDGGYMGLIADVIVKPNYQGRGIGTKLINKLLEQVKEGLHEDEEVLIELLSASGKTVFYRQFGFKDKKEVVEAGMYLWVKNKK